MVNYGDFNFEKMMEQQMVSQFTNWDEFIDWLLEEKHNLMEFLIDDLEDLSEFARGYQKGRIHAYEDILHNVRRKLKHGVLESVEDADGTDNG